MTDSLKRLCVFLDGTWNSVGDNTNVWRLKSLCSQKSSDGCEQRFYYDKGVNGFWGGTFGKGLIENVTEAYEWLVENYEKNDEIFIFGFSRGAYTARSLAGFIAKYGILRLGAPLGVGQIYERYKAKNDRTIWKLLELDQKGKLGPTSIEERWMLKFSIPAKIKMISVWDTVGALGIPIFSIKGISRSTLGFLHTGLRIPIEYGFHALAIDEHRHAFTPTPWTTKKTTAAQPRSLDSVEQRWFVGNHANVGGGYHSNLLAQRPLIWMKNKAERLGLTFRDDVLFDDDAYTSSIPDSYGEFMHGVYQWFSWPAYRDIGKSEIVVEGEPSLIVNETIDFSVFERWRRNDDYRPPSLEEWAKAKRVHMADFHHSVRADDPSVQVPD